MYLRQSDKWKQFLLQEAIEHRGLPPAAVTFIRRLNVEEGPIEEKHLSWLGDLARSVQTKKLLDWETERTIAAQTRTAVRKTLEKRGDWDPEGEEDREAFGELYALAISPLVEFKNRAKSGDPSLLDIKKFKKSMLKNLRGLEIDPQYIKGFDAWMDNNIRRVMTPWKDHMVPIIRLLAEDPYAYGELTDSPGLATAGIAAKQILANHPKAEEQVIHEFDNGYFWYDIRSDHCDYEAKKMGHCGRSDKGTLVSLRSGEGRRVKPMVTLEFDGKHLYQIKGKANRPPKEDLWPYIEWFIENMGVESIKEAPSEMMSHLKEKYPNLDWGDRWVSHADELLDQYEAGIETDPQTNIELDYASDGDDEEVGVVLTHQAYWPVLDIVVEEDSDKLVWEITQDAQSLANDTLYPNPSHVRAAVFRRGEQDSRTAMLRIEMWWSKSFEPPDPGDEYDAAYEEAVTKQLEHLHEFLEEMEEISGYLVSSASAPDDAEFDYNGFWEGIEKRLQEYGVFRDVAGEIDAEDERYDSPQMELPLQEQRIIQRWRQIIK